MHISVHNIHAVLFHYYCVILLSVLSNFSNNLWNVWKEDYSTLNIINYFLSSFSRAILILFFIRYNLKAKANTNFINLFWLIWGGADGDGSFTRNQTQGLKHIRNILQHYSTFLVRWEIFTSLFALGTISNDAHRLILALVLYSGVTNGDDWGIISGSGDWSSVSSIQSKNIIPCTISIVSTPINF